MNSKNSASKRKTRSVCSPACRRFGTRHTRSLRWQRAACRRPIRDWCSLLSGWPGGRSAVRPATTGQRSGYFGIVDAGRLPGAQTASTDHCVAGAGPSGNRSASQFPKEEAGKTQNPGVGNYPHPHLGEVRHDGCPDRRGLRRCRRRDRAHSSASLTRRLVVVRGQLFEPTERLSRA